MVAGRNPRLRPHNYRLGGFRMSDKHILVESIIVSAVNIDGLLDDLFAVAATSPSLGTPEQQRSQHPACLPITCQTAEETR